MHWLVAVSRAKVISKVIDWIAERIFRTAGRMTVVVQDMVFHESQLTRQQ